MKRLLTGLQPSGTLHIGNYFGALKPFVDLYGDYESFLMVVDYHALTSLRKPEELRQNIIEGVKDYIAAGVDPGKAIIFKQSDVPQHTELAWIFECLVTVPFLMQGHAYKDKIAKGLEPNAGLLTYPMLMAADILLYDTQVVPVGEDQRQHVEYAREAAAKFNNAFGQTFTEPEEKIAKGRGILQGTDGKKMSKSYKNTIPLFGTDDEIRASVMSIVTGSIPQGHPFEPAWINMDITFGLHRYLSADQLDALEKRYLEGSIGYKESKEILAENIIKLVSPMRQKRSSISDEEVKKILKEGGEKARTIAEAKMQDVRQKVGVTL